MNLHNGDCLEVMRGLADNSVDLVLTDPPYGLSFMGKKWDYDVPSVEIWAEALRVLKPGGYLLAFAGTRTQHRMACRIEDAGFEIRDMLAWVYGSGFPKSLDVSKAIGKAAGAVREVVGAYRAAVKSNNCGTSFSGSKGNVTGQTFASITIPATDAACEWDGWGTALKPALEPITMARKPLVGTVAANVLEYGTGGLNIDACRVGTDEERPYIISTASLPPKNALGGNLNGSKAAGTTLQGRWPANLLHDGSDEATAPMGSAARFFYCAKASKRERDAGVAHAGVGALRDGGRTQTERRNNHPTVKPIAIMEYLVQLASTPAAIVLDPFMGSGTTGIACRNLGREFIGIERDAEYFEIARNRILHTPNQMEIPA